MAANPSIFSKFKIFKEIEDPGNAVVNNELLLRGVKNDGTTYIDSYVPNTYAESQVREILDSIGATKALVEARRLCILLGGKVKESNVDANNPPGSIERDGAQANPLATDAADYYAGINNNIVQMKKDIAKKQKVKQEKI